MQGTSLKCEVLDRIPEHPLDSRYFVGEGGSLMIFSRDTFGYHTKVVKLAKETPCMVSSAVEDRSNLESCICETSFFRIFKNSLPNFSLDLTCLACWLLQRTREVTRVNGK